MSNGFLLSTNLRQALKKEVVNDHALLEVLEQVAWQFTNGAVSDVLSACIEEIDDIINTVDPTLEALNELADFRRRSQRDAELEQFFERKAA